MVIAFLAVAPDAIERETLIDAPPRVVWSIVTEDQHLAGWFSDEAEIELRPGGRMLLTWRGHGTYEGRVERHELDPRRHDTRGRGDRDTAPGRRERLRNAALARRRARPLRRRELE